MRGPQLLVDHLRQHNYHPRSDAHSNATCLGLLEDLLDHCPPVAEKAARGELVAQLNHTVTVNHQRWNIDLALGPPADNPRPLVEEERIRFAVPVVIEIAVEAKAVMTEHGKARHNRLRDLQAFHHHAHTYNHKVVAAAVIIVNVAKTFWSSTRSPADITQHAGIETLGRRRSISFAIYPCATRRLRGRGSKLPEFSSSATTTWGSIPICRRVLRSRRPPD